MNTDTLLKFESVPHLYDATAINDKPLLGTKCLLSHCKKKKKKCPTDAPFMDVRHDVIHYFICVIGGRCLKNQKVVRGGYRVVILAGFLGNNNTN